MEKIIVVDAMPGKFKTSWAMQDMVVRGNAMPFIYITPYLDEVDRVVEFVSKRGVRVSIPEARRGKGSKTEHLKKLISEKKNIITTHALIDRIDSETLELFKLNGYALYMDEVHEVVRQHFMTEQDLYLLTSSNYIKIHNDGKIEWIAEDYDGRFEEFKNLCELGALFYYADKVYVWTFPIELFNYMKQIYILTYKFEGQIQCAYYKMYGLKYEKKYVWKHGNILVLLDYSQTYDDIDVENIADKIHIYEGNLNLGKGIKLTSSFFIKADKSTLKVVRNNVLNYFQNIIKGKSEENMWTTLKDYKKDLKGKGYTKGFVPLNCRSTNMYQHKKNLAYVYNRYLNPIDKNFFHRRGIQIDEDLYALSELIQWIFRSAIRKGEDINIYIPSLRMRTLLKEYLGK